MQFHLYFLALFASAQVAAQGCKPMAGGIVSNCGNGKDDFILKSVKIAGKPQRGKDLKVHVEGELRQTINKGAKVTIKVKRRGITLINLNKDLCELLVERKVGVKCPIKPGKYSKDQVLPIPGFAPTGSYDIEAFGTNKNGRRIFKVNIKATI